MKFLPTGLEGAFVVEIEKKQDPRGFFARTFCKREFAEHGLCTEFVQCSVSHNRRKGTLRGMHFQSAPFEEIKLVSCIRGALYDVVLDLRRRSPTFKKHFSITLSAENHTALYIPEGFAHAFQTLEDDTEAFYQISQFYSPDHACGVRWNDPAFGIAWPEVENRIILDRDREYPLFED